MKFRVSEFVGRIGTNSLLIDCDSTDSLCALISPWVEASAYSRQRVKLSFSVHLFVRKIQQVVPIQPMLLTDVVSMTTQQSMFHAAPVS